jgi:protein associated with RNAse G/E
MNLFLIIILNIYLYQLYFFLNEEVLLFITFSLFFFIAIKILSSIVLKSMNLTRYKLYTKFLKMSIVLLKCLQKNRKILNSFYKLYLTNFKLHFSINYYPDFRKYKITKI